MASRNRGQGDRGGPGHAGARDRHDDDVDARRSEGRRRRRPQHGDHSRADVLHARGPYRLVRGQPGLQVQDGLHSRPRDGRFPLARPLAHAPARRHRARHDARARLGQERGQRGRAARLYFSRHAARPIRRWDRGAPTRPLDAHCRRSGAGGPLRRHQLGLSEPRPGHRNARASRGRRAALRRGAQSGRRSSTPRTPSPPVRKRRSS